MFIRDKADAIMQMNNLGLNVFPSITVQVGDDETVRQFLEEFPAEEYCLRDPNGTVGKFFFVKSAEEIIEKSKEYDGQYTLGVSANPYKEDIVLLGDVKVYKDDNMVDLTARTDPEANHRNIYSEPQINLHISLDSNELWDVPGFSKLMGYISTYELYDIVVEFVVYSCRVGKNKENVVIFELRSEY